MIYGPLDSSKMAQLADAIAGRGYGIFPDFLEEGRARSLVGLIQNKMETDALERAGVGRGAMKKVVTEIRSDSVYWLDQEDASEITRGWLGAMDALCGYFRQTLFLPLWSYEGHLACYPASGFYKAHLDQHQQTQARQVSIITYLNEAWDEGDGGQLRLYVDVAQGTTGPYVDVVPRLGTVVVFRSGDFWHEVLPARRARLSLTGWLRGRVAVPF